MTESTITKIEIQEGLRAGADAWFVVRVDTQGDRDLSQDDLHVCTDSTDAERLAEIERDNHGLPPSRQVGPGQPPLIYPDTAVTLSAQGTPASFSRAVELCVGTELRRLAEQPAEPTRDLLAARAAWLRRRSGRQSSVTSGPPVGALRRPQPAQARRGRGLGHRQPGLTLCPSFG